MIHRLICRLSVLQEWQNSTAPQCKKKKKKNPPKNAFMFSKPSKL